MGLKFICDQHINESRDLSLVGSGSRPAIKRQWLHIQYNHIALQGCPGNNKLTSKYPEKEQTAIAKTFRAFHGAPETPKSNRKSPHSIITTPASNRPQNTKLLSPDSVLNFFPIPAHLEGTVVTRKNIETIHSLINVQQQISLRSNSHSFQLQLNLSETVFDDENCTLGIGPAGRRDHGHQGSPRKSTRRQAHVQLPDSGSRCLWVGKIITVIP